MSRECVEIEWVSLEANLVDHLHSIFRQLERNFNMVIRNLYIMPPHAKQRSTAASHARTTSIFIELDDSTQHPQLCRLLDNFPFHNHGWRTQMGRYGFAPNDIVRQLNPSRCPECRDFTKTINTRADNLKKQAEQRRNAFMLLEPAESAAAISTPPSLVTPYRPAGCSIASDNAPLQAASQHNVNTA